MKRTFRPHIVLTIGGRILTLIFITIPMLMLYKFIEFAFFQEEINYDFLPFIAFAIGLVILVLWMFGFLWQQVWGKLIITDKDII